MQRVNIAFMVEIFEKAENEAVKGREVEMIAIQSEAMEKLLRQHFPFLDSTGVFLPDARLQEKMPGA
jgi:hypothetical protein